MSEHTENVAYLAELHRFGGGWNAATSVDAFGGTSLWLIADGAVAHSGGGRIPEHERLGRLTADWRRRVGLQCAAFTKSGKRCLNTVQSFGGVCASHAPEIDR